MRGWHAPIDPGCPEVQRFADETLADPMTQAYGMGDELLEAFERRHRRDCERCQEYGAANIEVAS